MTIDHADFTIEKIVPAQLANVFRAFAEQELKRKWFAGSGPKSMADYRLDFRVGGQEGGKFEIAEGPGAGLHQFAGTDIDIVEAERIVFAYTMARDGRVHSASLATVTFTPSEAGCKLTIIEQSVHFAPSDGPETRRGGVEAQFDALARPFN